MPYSSRSMWRADYYFVLTMKFAALVALLAAVIGSASAALQHQHTQQQLVLDVDAVNAVNSISTLPWKAAVSPRFAKTTVQEARGMMKTAKRRSHVAIDALQQLRIKAGLPPAFDSRTNWPGCIHPILDQGQCGSCWAFGASEVLSDRFCIESKGKITAALSPESLVSCDWEGNFGCSGGIPQLAWEYMEWSGLLTLDCFPYTAGGGNAPSCPSSCPGTGSYQKYYAKFGSTSSFWSEAEIMQEIYANGPVEGTMSVYSDFMGYSSGVYTQTANATYLGGHAIKIVGWGHDTVSNLDYWIVANSWGTSWGINGFFWIQRGVDMCGIDSDATAGRAAV